MKRGKFGGLMREGEMVMKRWVIDIYGGVIMNKVPKAIFCLCIGFVTLSVHADVFLKYKKTTSAYSMGGLTVPEKTIYVSYWIGKNQMSIDNGENGRCIIDNKGNKFINIDYKSNSFSVFLLDQTYTINKADKKSAPDNKESGQRMEMMNAMAERMKMTVLPKQEKKKIGSWECNRYDVTYSGIGESTDEMWVTKQIKIDALNFNKLRFSMMASLPGYEKILKELKKIDGVLVLTRSITKVMTSQVRSEDMLIEHAEKTPPAGIFEIPKGFRENKAAHYSNEENKEEE
jgi:hypothetical protein